MVLTSRRRGPGWGCRSWTGANVRSRKYKYKLNAGKNTIDEKEKFKQQQIPITIVLMRIALIKRVRSWYICSSHSKGGAPGAVVSVCAHYITPTSLITPLVWSSHQSDHSTRLIIPLVLTISHPQVWSSSIIWEEQMQKKVIQADSDKTAYSDFRASWSMLNFCNPVSKWLLREKKHIRKSEGLVAKQVTH